jgi:hypothetical protein
VAKPKIRLDRAGMRAMLSSGEVSAAVEGLAHSVAAIAAGEPAHSDGPIPVEVDTHTTDRAAASVRLAHPAGLSKEAKYGILTRAAASAGLDVTARPPS